MVICCGGVMLSQGVHPLRLREWSSSIDEDDSLSRAVEDRVGGVSKMLWTGLVLLGDATHVGCRLL